jgi:hypothetical protein
MGRGSGVESASLLDLAGVADMPRRAAPTLDCTALLRAPHYA